MKVTVEGLADLDAALGQLTKAAGFKAMRQTLLKAGAPIQEQAQADAPERPANAPDVTYRANGVERRRRPGTLKVLVQIGTRLTRNQSRLARADGKNTVEVYVGTRDPVGRLREQGTAQAPPSPFLRPAWEAHKEGALETIKTELAVEIQAAAERAGKRAAAAARRLARQSKQTGG
jgi:HK97 gp10 family phage protein